MKVPHCGMFFAVKILYNPNQLAGFCIMTILNFNELTAKLNVLRLNCWKIPQVIQKCQGSTSLNKIPY